MKTFCRDIQDIISEATQLKQIYRNDLFYGDVLIVVTCNSVYNIQVLKENYFLVSGGWFDREGVSPQKIAINGCTWGGSIIKADIIAACGLHLEFASSLLTSSIKKVFVIRHGNLN